MMKVSFLLERGDEPFERASLQRSARGSLLRDDESSSRNSKLSKSLTLDMKLTMAICRSKRHTP